jgi:hypothetical protein
MLLTPFKQFVKTGITIVKKRVILDANIVIRWIAKEDKQLLTIKHLALSVEQFYANGC